MQQGWDPQVKLFFRKIINSISFGLLWMMAVMGAGIYFDLGSSKGKPLAYTISFYLVSGLTLFFLLKYFYRTWKSK